MSDPRGKPPSYAQLVIALGAALDIIERLRGPQLFSMRIARQTKRLQKVWARAADNAGPPKAAT